MTLSRGFKPSFFLALLTGLALHLSAAEVGVNPSFDEKEWKESAVPAPPAFAMAKLLPFSGLVSSPLTYGVDPASIAISPSDGLVRYVLVASVPGGAKNVMYEAIRCETGEFKTYARYSLDGRWSNTADPQWQSMFDAPSRHALYFARAGACDSAAPPRTVDVLVSRLKNPNSRFTD